MRDFSHQLLMLLKGRFAGLNLTRITEEEDFYQKQVLDSVSAYEQSKTFSQRLNQRSCHIDVGFGGGFPLLPMAKRCPAINFYGFEAREKKVRAVQTMADLLELKNIKCFHQRYENVVYDRPATVSFKAVGPIKKILSGFSNFVELDVFFYKGPQVYELEGVEKEHDGWKLICEDKMTVPGTEARYLIGYTKKSVPRGTKSNKELVNLSALV